MNANILLPLGGQHPLHHVRVVIEEGDVGDAGPETTDSPVPDDPGGDDEV